jgi:hypothetical protein
MGMIHQKIRSIILAVPLLALAFAGCTNDGGPNSGSYSQYKPIFMSRSQLESSIKAVADRPITNPAKIFLFGNRIYMTEPYKGVYIVDNTDPAKPANMGFISIPGLNDAVVKDGVLIADNALDIVGIDVENPAQPQVLWRRRNALPPMAPPDNLPSRPISGATAESIVVEWVLN